MNDLDDRISESVAFYNFHITLKDRNILYTHLWQQEVFKNYIEKSILHDALMTKVIVFEPPNLLEFERARIENINATVKYVQDWLKKNIKYDYE